MMISYVLGVLFPIQFIAALPIASIERLPGQLSVEFRPEKERKRSITTRLIIKLEGRPFVFVNVFIMAANLRQCPSMST